MFKIHNVAKGNIEIQKQNSNSFNSNNCFRDFEHVIVSNNSFKSELFSVDKENIAINKR